MTFARYLEFQRAEIAKLEDALTCVNLAVQTRHAMIARGHLQRMIDDQRQCITLTQRAMATTA